MIAGRIVCGVVVLLLSIVPALSCEGRLDNVSKSGAKDYDPFSTIEQHERYDITVRNIGSERCNYAIGFVRVPAVGKLGNVLPYSVRDDRGHNLLSDTSAPQRVTPVLHLVTPGDVKVITVYVTVSRGSFAVPGEYQDIIRMNLFASKGGASLEYAPIDQQDVVVARRVNPCFQVSIAGAGLATTVEFGELTAGTERSIILNTSSNQGYRLEITSRNGGYLALDPAIPGEVWRVGYTFRIDDVVMPLTAGASISQEDVTANGERSRRLIFRMNDPSKMRSGQYRDVITIKIGVRT